MRAGSTHATLMCLLWGTGPRCGLVGRIDAANAEFITVRDVVSVRAVPQELRSANQGSAGQSGLAV